MEEIVKTAEKVLSILPTPVLAGIVMILGVLIARVLDVVFSRLLKLVRADRAAEKTGLAGFLRKGAVKYTISQLVGRLIFWIVFIMTLLFAASILDVHVADILSQHISTAFPSIVSAFFVVIVGWIVVSFVGNFTLTVTRNAAVPHAELIARLVKILGIVVVIGIAVEQLDFNLTIVNSLLLIVAASVGLGLALAFGLGCKELARDALQRFLFRLRERDRVGRGDDLEG